MDVEEASGGIAFVILRGRLDTAGANDIDLKFNAIAGARRAVVVGLSQVDFLASLGIRVLVLSPSEGRLCEPLRPPYAQSPTRGPHPEPTRAHVYDN